MRKPLSRSLFILLSVSLLFISSCNKENVKQDCGGDSEVIDTIPVSADLAGELTYKRQSDPDDDLYNEKYWIFIVPTDSSSSWWVNDLIVCNEEALSDFSYIKETGGSVNIKFSGYVKKICEQQISPPEYSYRHIVITGIETQ